MRLFAQVPQQRRLLQRGVGSERGPTNASADSFKEGFLFIPQKLNEFVGRAERLQELMAQGTGKPPLSSLLNGSRLPAWSKCLVSLLLP